MARTQMADTPSPSKPRKPKRRRRWLDRLLVLLLLCVGGYFLLMQSFLTRWFVMAQIGKQTGGEASASSVILGFDGNIVIRDAKLRAPGIPGEAGTIVSVKRLEADFDWSSLFGGGLAIHRIELDQPMARISQSIDDGTVNIAALKPPKSTAPPKEVPKIIVHGGVIELGEHVSDEAKLAAGVPAYTALKSLAVGGEVLETPDETGGKLFSFHEVEGALPVPGGLAVKGRISKEGIRLTLEGVSLSTWTADSTPTPSRELFRQAAMQGEIPTAVITYAYSGGWEARIGLANVAVNLPVTARPDEDDAGNQLPQSEADKKRLLRMEKVNGEMVFTNKGVVAKLKGLMEELPYEVEFQMDGTTADAGFVCTLESKGFALTKKPQIMKFAPGVARRRLDQFSNPTGIVDAKVIVTRGQPVNGKEADVEVNGVIHFHDVTAAFEKFPYRFTKMVGEITFDANRIDLVSIDGQAEQGVKVHASGVISPPTDAAGVDLEVHVLNLPIDDKLRKAMLGRARVLDALFSQDRYQELVNAGLIASPTQHDQAMSQLARLEAAGQGDSDEAQRLQTTAHLPIFELGGRAEVGVKIHRPVGPDAEWEDLEVISLADAGLLPDRVPFPLLADEVTIVKRDAVATVEGGVYRGLTGGTATLSAKADFSKIDDPKLPFIPDVEVEARDIPANALLINCLPESKQFAAGASLHQMLADLNMAGLLDSSVHLGMTEKNDPFFRIETTLKGLISRPHTADQPARLLLAAITGQVVVTQDELSLNLAATAAGIGGSVDPSPATVQFSMPIVAQLSDLAAPKNNDDKPLTLSASAKALDASLPIEDLVGIFATSPAQNLVALRHQYAPYGVADATVNITQPASGNSTTTVQVANVHAFELTALGGRIGLESSTGSLTITTNSAPGPALMSAQSLSGPLMYQGEPVGELTANGSILSDAKPAPGSQGMTLSLKDGRLESGLTTNAARELGPRSLSDFLAKSTVSGVYDLDLSIGSPSSASSPGSGSVRGVFRPRTLHMVMHETPVTFTSVSGAVEFDGADGRLRALRLSAPTWSAAADGTWIQVPGGTTAFQSTLSLTSVGMPPDLLAVIPDDLREVFTDLSFEAAGPLEMTDAHLSLTFDDKGSVAAFKSNGQVSMLAAKLDIGATVKDINGTLDYTVSRTTAGVPVDFELWALLDGFNLSGVSMTNGRVRAASGSAGEILVPLVSADCHGGRIAASATVSPPDLGKRRYEALLTASDVRFASVLSDFQAVAPHDPEQTPLTQLADESRGRLDMGLSLAGIANDLDSRRGRGTATVGGGRIVNIPLLVPLVRLTNLQLPIDEGLDYAFTEFFIEGRQMTLSEVSISSKSVGVYGYGVATLPDLNLNLRFETKSRSGIPVLTKAAEFVRNQLITAEVTGTLAKPQMSLSPLSGATRFFGRLFGTSASQQEHALQLIEQRAERDPRRPLRTGQKPVEPR